MRRIFVTMAVALFSVAAPVTPSSAATLHHKSAHVVVANPPVRDRDMRQDRMEHVEFEAEAALSVVASRFHLTRRQMVARWQRVAECEVNGNWHMEGSLYSGIGFSNTTWDAYGGRRYGPLAGDATPVQQVLVGMSITKTWIPDQFGCTPGGW